MVKTERTRRDREINNFFFKLELTFSVAEDFFFFDPDVLALGPMTGAKPLRPGIETAAAAAAALTTLCFRISLSGLSLNSVLLTPPPPPPAPTAATLAAFVVTGGGIRGNTGLENMDALSFGMGALGAIRPPPEHLVD